ncbi:MAG: hypothetical protein NVSMB9_06530 [Isosphaeraceae bacterium]
MGEVYKARQLNLNRLVALKMIHVQWRRRSDQLARFRAETEALARLPSPHIVQIFQVSEHEGRPFFIMELAEQDLQSKLRGEPLSPVEGARLVASLARAMHQAHQRGIVHRDLKPSNILLGADGSPKVADFGLVKFLDEETGPTATTEAFLGTASYMAPEQARGHSHQVGPAADIYSLGAILYETLTGRPPFKATTFIGTAMLVVNEETIPPARLQPGLPRDLETICLRCLQKAPSRRYGSADELADDLERFLRNEPILSRPTGVATRLWYWSRRHPNLAAFGGTAALAMVAVAALSVLFGIIQARAARREGRIASGLMIDKGVLLCERGNIGGMLWMARALADATRAGAHDLEQNIRANLAGWRGRVCPLQAILEHADVVRAVAFSPDGRLLLTGCLDGSARLWDAKTGEPRGKPIQLKGVVWGVAFSPDGRQFLVGCEDHTAQLRDVETGQLLRSFVHPHQVRAVAFGPRGPSTILTGCVDGSARLWDTGKGEPIRTFQHDGEVFAVAFSPDGRSLLTGCMDGMAHRWDTASGRELHRYEDPGQGEVRVVSFSPDGRTVLTGGLDMYARLWDTESGKLLRKLSHPRGVTALAFCPEGRTILTVSARGPVQFWHAAEGIPIQRFLPHPGVVQSLAVSADGRSLLTGGKDGSARLWRMDLQERPVIPLTPPADVFVAVFRPDGKTLLTGCVDGSLRLFDAATGQSLPFETVRHQAEIELVVFSRNGNRFLTGSVDKTATIRDADTGKLVVPALKHQAAVTAGAFSADGRRVVTGSEEGFAQLWDAATGSRLGKPLPHPGTVSAVAFSTDGRQVVTGCWDRKARVWDVGTGALIAGPCVHHGSVLSVSFSPDGRSILTGSDDGGVQLWDAASGKSIGESMLHREAVSVIAFSRDGKSLLAGSKDGRTSPWQPATGKPLGPPVRLDPSILALSFHPDGRSFQTSNGQVIGEGSIPNLMEGTAESIQHWCQVVSGIRLDEDGALLMLDTVDWKQTQKRLNAMGVPSPLGVRPVKGVDLLRGK